MVLLCTHDKNISCFAGRFYVNSFLSFFFLEQTDVLKQTHIVITDHQVAETLYGIKAHISMKHRQ